LRWIKISIIKIGDRLVGYEERCFIIAEAGVNHNGDINLAKKLIESAKDAGADAVKFQTFKTENLVTKHAAIVEYQKNSRKKYWQSEIMKKIELKYKDFEILKELCDKKKIIFLSTPHSFDAIDFLEDLVPAYKFGSGDITNIPTLKYAAKKGKPMILGTGMSTLQEVREAINAIKSEGNTQIIALHCTTNYPCPLEDVNLRAMITMQNELDCLVGYSDHTLSILVPAIAVAMGAVVIEKHFTLDRNLPGPDHKASLEPHELKKMVKEIRSTEKILGRFDKKPTTSEKEIMKYVRKSIVAKKDIEKGSIIEEDMLIVKRPGTGLSPVYLSKIIGKKTKRRIVKDELIQLDMVE
jgi:N-acetylneuraminate synthase/N,N'-diacetyllegionaminate synthase